MLWEQQVHCDPAVTPDVVDNVVVSPTWLHGFRLPECGHMYGQGGFTKGHVAHQFRREAPARSLTVPRSYVHVDLIEVRTLLIIQLANLSPALWAPRIPVSHWAIS